MAELDLDAQLAEEFDRLERLPASYSQPRRTLENALPQGDLQSEFDRLEGLSTQAKLTTPQRFDLILPPSSRGEMLAPPERGVAVNPVAKRTPGGLMSVLRSGWDSGNASSPIADELEQDSGPVGRALVGTGRMAGRTLGLAGKVVKSAAQDLAELPAAAMGYQEPTRNLKSLEKTSILGVIGGTEKQPGPTPFDVQTAQSGPVQHFIRTFASTFAETTPQLAAGYGLGAAGVPSAISAGLPMLVTPDGNYDPLGATIAAGLPGVTHLGEAAMAKILGSAPVTKAVLTVLSDDPLKLKAKLVQNIGFGVEVSNDQFRKFLESGGGFMAANAYLLAAKSPELAALAPDQRPTAILDMVAQNLAPALLGFIRPGMSKTLAGKAPEIAPELGEIVQGLRQTANQKKGKTNAPNTEPKSSSVSEQPEGASTLEKEKQAGGHGDSVPGAAGQPGQAGADVAAGQPAPTNPAVATPAPTVEELPATIAAQMEMLTSGKRNVVMITPGEKLPEVPEGMAKLPTPAGTFIFNPIEVHPDDIREAVKNNTLGDLLGYGIAAKPEKGTEVGAIVVRAPDGTEKQGVLTDADHLASVTDAANAVKSPGDTVNIESEADVIAKRQPVPENFGFVQGENPKVELRIKGKVESWHPHESYLESTRPEEIQAGTAKPLKATELRVLTPNGKVETVLTAGHLHHSITGKTLELGLYQDIAGRLWASELKEVKPPTPTAGPDRIRRIQIQDEGIQVVFPDKVHTDLFALNSRFGKLKDKGPESAAALTQDLKRVAQAFGFKDQAETMQASQAYRQRVVDMAKQAITDGKTSFEAPKHMAESPAIEKPAKKFAKETGWTFKPNGAVSTEGMPPELAARMPKQWEFTDRREDSVTKGFTFYVPEGASYDQIKAAHDRKMAEINPVNKEEETPSLVKTPPLNQSVETAGNVNQKPEEPKPEPTAAKPSLPEPKIFTNQAADDAKARLKKKLGGTNAGVDPTILGDVVVIAGNVIERGAIKYSAYAKAMAAEVGKDLKAFFKPAYNQVRDFTEAYALRKEMTSREEVEKYEEAENDIPTAEGTGRESQPAGAVRGNGSSGRPGIRVVDEGDIPESRSIVRAGQYKGAAGHSIDETQRFAANLALTAFSNDNKAFLLGDGTGVGKTATELVIAAEMAKTTGLPSLIVTQSKPIIQNRFKADAIRFGVPTDKIHFATYTDLSLGKIPEGEFGSVVYDECFVRGTEIRMADGSIKPIENIVQGDAVKNAIGNGLVKSTMRRMTDHLVNVETSSGRFTCTRNHPVLTQKGWVRAGQLTRLHEIKTHDQTLRVVRERSDFQKPEDAFLWKLLRGEMEAGATVQPSEALQQIGQAENLCQEQNIARSGQRLCHSIFEPHEGAKSNEVSRYAGESFQNAQEDWSCSTGSWRKWNRANEGRAGIAQCVPGIGKQFRGKNSETGHSISKALQDRRGLPGNHARNRVRWIFSQSPRPTVPRQAKRGEASRIRVVSVEIVKQESFGGYGGGDCGTEVFNLEVGGHPSYVLASGAVVHNCHNLKNAGSARSFKSKLVNAQHRVFATATPMDSPTHAAYFLAQLTGRTENQIASSLGYTFKKRMVNGEERDFAVLKPDYSWRDVIDNIKRLRLRAVQSGLLIRREYPFYGTANFHPTRPLTQAQVKEQDMIEHYWDEIIKRTSSPNAQRNYSGQKTLELSRWLEAQKFEEARDRILQDLEDKSRKVVVFAEGYSDTMIKGTGKTVPGVLSLLANELDKREIKYAKVFEDNAKKKGDAAATFQEDPEVLVLLATPRSGGAGLDMDDIIGDQPRVAHFLTINFGGDVFEQMVGRVSRRNTKSPAEVHIWRNLGGYSDRRRQNVLDRKLSVLRNIQSGEDLDTSEFAKAPDIASPLQGSLALAQQADAVAPVPEPTPIPQEEQPKPLPDYTARSVEELRSILPHVGLPAQTERLMTEFLSEPVISMAPDIKTFITDDLDGGFQGTTERRPNAQTVVRVVRRADPKTGVHEMVHGLLWEITPKDMKAELERQRVATADLHIQEAQDAGKTETVGYLTDIRDNPTSDVDEFLSRNYPVALRSMLYPLSSAEEYFAHTMSEHYEKKVGSVVEGFWQKVKSIISNIISAIKRALRLRPNQKEFLDKILAGDFEPEIAEDVAYAERQASLDPDSFDDIPRERTQIFGTKYYVNAKEGITDQSIEASSALAKEVFDAVGIPVTEQLSPKDDQFPNRRAWLAPAQGRDMTPEGEKLLARLKEELKTWATQPPGRLANLINSIRLGMFVFENSAFAEMSPGIRTELEEISQSLPSFIGASLNAFAGVRKDLAVIGRNLDVTLGRLWSDRFGGDDLRRVLDELKAAKERGENLQKALDEALKKVGAGGGHGKGPGPGLTKTWGSGTRQGKKIIELVQGGRGDAWNVLREIAKLSGWQVPDETDLQRVKDLLDRADRMLELTPEEKAEAGDDPARIAAALETVRQTRPATDLMKQVSLAITRWTRPLNWKQYWATPQNNAAALNEYAIANTLLKPGFMGFRLIAHLGGQFLIVHMPTRALATVTENAMRLRAEGVTDYGLWKLTHEAFKEQGMGFLNAIRPGLRRFEAAFMGRGEGRNVDRLKSGIMLFERMQAKAEEYWQKGDYGRAAMTWLVGLPKFSLRFLDGLDRLQGTAVEFAEIRHQIAQWQRENGRSNPEIVAQADSIMKGLSEKQEAAYQDANRILAARGEPFTSRQLEEKAWEIVVQRIYRDMAAIGMPADDFRSANDHLMKTVAWQQPVVTGPGGLLAGAMKTIREVAATKGIPTPFLNFGNAVGTGINYALQNTPLYGITAWGKRGVVSPSFATDKDRYQRRWQALVGTLVGALLFALIKAGIARVYNQAPKDKEERQLWEAQGHRAGTVEFRLNDHEVSVWSLTVGPGALYAPYLAAGGAVQDAEEIRAKRQAKMNAEAEKLGLTPGKVAPLDALEQSAIAGKALWGILMANKALSGIVQSGTEFGIPNVKKMAASQISPYVVGLPGYQEISRGMGVALDPKMATVWDYLVPLPTSGARAVNFLGDPVGTPDALQRMVQTMTAGTYPIVDLDQAKGTAAYAAMLNSGYRPPSIDPNKAYAIDGEYRPLNSRELEQYSVTRGEFLKQELTDLGPDATAKDAAGAYSRANRQALSEIGVSAPGSGTRSNGQTPAQAGPSVAGTSRTRGYTPPNAPRASTAGTPRPRTPRTARALASAGHVRALPRAARPPRGATLGRVGRGLALSAAGPRRRRGLLR